MTAMMLKPRALRAVLLQACDASDASSAPTTPGAGPVPADRASSRGLAAALQTQHDPQGAGKSAAQGLSALDALVASALSGDLLASTGSGSGPQAQQRDRLVGALALHVWAAHAGSAPSSQRSSSSSSSGFSSASASASSGSMAGVDAAALGLAVARACGGRDEEDVSASANISGSSGVSSVSGSGGGGASSASSVAGTPSAGAGESGNAGEPDVAAAGAEGAAGSSSAGSAAAGDKAGTTASTGGHEEAGTGNSTGVNTDKAGGEASRSGDEAEDANESKAQSIRTPSGLQCLCVESEEGKLAITSAGNFLIVVYGQKLSDFGLLRAKVMALQAYLHEPLQKLSNN